MSILLSFFFFFCFWFLLPKKLHTARCANTAHLFTFWAVVLVWERQKVLWVWHTLAMWRHIYRISTAFLSSSSSCSSSRLWTSNKGHKYSSSLLLLQAQHTKIRSSLKCNSPRAASVGACACMVLSVFSLIRRRSPRLSLASLVGQNFVMAHIV